MKTKTQRFKDSSPRLFEYRDWEKPADRLSCLVSQYVDRFNLSEVYATYKGGGASAYDPKALLTGVLISFLNNKYSYRDLQDSFAYDMRVRWLVGGTQPSHMTIWRFLNNHLGKLVFDCFRQLLYILVDAGLIDIAVIYIDGTTIESRASRYSIVWRKEVNRRAKACSEKIEALLAMIQGETVELPKDDNGILTDEAIATVNKKLADSGSGAPGQDDAPASAGKGAGSREKAKAARETREAIDRLRGHREDLTAMGSCNSLSRTDRGAAGMRPKDDVRKTGPNLAMHNMQIATSSHFITGVGLFRTPSDAATFPIFLKDTLNTYEQIRAWLMVKFLTKGVNTEQDRRNFLMLVLNGPVPDIAAVADAGYGTPANYNLCAGLNVKPYLKYPTYDYERQLARRREGTEPKDRDFHFACFPYDSATDTFVCPAQQRLALVATAPPDDRHPKGTATYACDNCADCPLLERCRQKGTFDDKGRRTGQADTEWRDLKAEAKLLLDTGRGRELLRNRTLEPEPAFSHIKVCHHYRRLRHFNPLRALIDVTLMCMARNIAKAAAVLGAEGAAGPRGGRPSAPLASPAAAEAGKTSKIRKSEKRAARSVIFVPAASWRLAAA